MEIVAPLIKEILPPAAVNESALILLLTSRFSKASTIISPAFPKLLLVVIFPRI